MGLRLTVAIVVVLLLGGVCPSFAQSIDPPQQVAAQSHLSSALPAIPARLTNPKRSSTLAAPMAVGAPASASLLPEFSVAVYTQVSEFELPPTGQASVVSTRGPPSEYTLQIHAF
jgi:hypothetical protein